MCLGTCSRVPYVYDSVVSGNIPVRFSFLLDRLTEEVRQTSRKVLFSLSHNIHDFKIKSDKCFINFLPEILPILALFSSKSKNSGGKLPNYVYSPYEIYIA